MPMPNRARRAVDLGAVTDVTKRNVFRTLISNPVHLKGPSDCAWKAVTAFRAQG